jgi:ElaB/YqjD/DUF883 family membrane-anchored ribosome-binding protein
LITLQPTQGVILFNTQSTEASPSLIDQAAPIFDRAVDQVSALAHQGVSSVRDGSQVLRSKALHASDSTVSYIREEPVKSVLIAAATGAALMAVLALLGRSRR